MPLLQNKKTYFLSDFHLGAPDHATSLVREKRIVKFLSLEIFLIFGMSIKMLFPKVL
jgi:hypothetical protein